MRNCKRQGGAPFPYFGGKARVAAEVWAALGEPHHYLEPFFGSGAVLLARPQPSAAGIETVCDADGYLCNVWRAGYEPEHNESPGARLDAGRLERVRRVWQPGPRAHEPPSRAALPLAPLQSAG